MQLQFFCGQGFRIILQSVSFFLVARHLGPEQYGLYALTLALTAWFGTLTDAGGYHLVIRDMAAGDLAERALGRALARVLIVSLVLFPIAALLKTVLLYELSWLLFLGILVSEWLLTRLTAFIMACHISAERNRTNAILEGLFGFF